MLKLLPRAPADVNVQENHVWTLLLHKTQCDTKNKLENLEETAPVTDLVRYESHLNHI